VFSTTADAEDSSSAHRNRSIGMNVFLYGDESIGVLEENAEDRAFDRHVCLITRKQNKRHTIAVADARGSISIDVTEDGWSARIRDGMGVPTKVERPV